MKLEISKKKSGGFTRVWKRHRNNQQVKERKRGIRKYFGQAKLVLQHSDLQKAAKDQRRRQEGPKPRKEDLN